MLVKGTRYDSPIPVASIEFWELGHVLATNGDVWARTGIGNNWATCGPWPGGAVPTSENTWGSVKDKYKE